MISPAGIPTPAQIGAGRPSIGSETRIELAGTATKAIRDELLLGSRQAQAVQLDLGQLAAGTGRDR